MDLTIIGSTKKKRAAAEDMVWFAKDFLMPRIQNITIAVELVNNLAEKEGAEGWCMDEGEREFTITINASQELDDILETIAHEMVHVKQYARGEHAQLMTRGVYRWKKEYFPLDYPYKKQPWEKEAYKLEKVIMKAYKKAQK